MAYIDSGKGGNDSPRTDKTEHIGPLDTGDNIEAKRVAVYETVDGVNWVRAGSNGTARYDYSDSTTIYVGAAMLEVADATTSGWVITKYDLSDSSNASGKVATDVSWTNRATGSYN